MLQPWYQQTLKPPLIIILLTPKQGLNSLLRNRL